MIFPLLFTFAGLIALLATYLFIFLCYRASIDAVKARTELLNAQMRIDAYQERRDALYPRR